MTLLDMKRARLAALSVGTGALGGGCAEVSAVPDAVAQSVLRARVRPLSVRPWALDPGMIGPRTSRHGDCGTRVASQPRMEAQTAIRLLWTPVLALLIGAVAGCGGDTDRDSAETGLAGTSAADDGIGGGAQPGESGGGTGGVAEETGGSTSSAGGSAGGRASGGSSGGDAGSGNGGGDAGSSGGDAGSSGGSAGAAGSRGNEPCPPAPEETGICDYGAGCSEGRLTCICTAMSMPDEDWPRWVCAQLPAECPLEPAYQTPCDDANIDCWYMNVMTSCSCVAGTWSCGEFDF